jgi:hypothetical protein
MRIIATSILSALGSLALRAQDPRPPASRHPIYLQLDEEPSAPKPEVFWNGYPTKKWQQLELEIEQRVAAARQAENQKGIEVFEELRFLARAHARGKLGEGKGNGSGPLSEHFGYVCDRAGALYGWLPTEWVIPNGAFRDKYMIGSNGSATTATTGEGWVDRGWMTIAPVRQAILTPGVRLVGVGLGGDKTTTAGHLIYAAMPTITYQRLEALQPLYQQIASAKKPSEVKELLDKVVAQKEGSSFFRIAALLKDPDREVRLAAVRALGKLHEAVPAAKGPLFALVEFGVMSSSPDTALESAKTLKALTGQAFTTPDAWADWWASNWKTYRRGDPPAAPAHIAAPAKPAIWPKDKDLTQSLNALENWTAGGDTWTEQGGGIRGSGDSHLRFKAKIPKNIALEFSINVIEGMRPRIHFDNCDLFFGNEGYEKTLFVYGNGATNVQGLSAPYRNGQTLRLRVEFSGDTFAFWVDGKLIAHGKRSVPADDLSLRLRAGDNWSRGTTHFSDFSAFPKFP